MKPLPDGLEPLSLLFVVGSLYEKSSGVYLSLLETARELHALGHQPVVVGSKDRWSQGPPTDWAPVPVHALRKIGPYSFHCTPGLGRLLNGLEHSIDAASFQSVWQYNNLQAARWCRDRKIPYMVTVHGNLNPTALAVSKTKKALVRKWFVDDLLRNATCLQALTTDEHGMIRRFGLKQPVCLIPNGIRLGADISTDAAKSGKTEKICLHLGRLHPIKNLAGFLRAWKTAGETTAGWNFVLVGPDEGGHQAELQGLVSELGIGGQVEFVGPRYGDAKTEWFQRADFFVLPSLSEGFPMALVEALAHGLPVLCTTNCHFPEAARTLAGIETGSSPDELAEGIRAMTRLSDAERLEMGRRGIELVGEKYRWESVAEQLVAVYRWMTGQGPAPATLISD